MTTPTDPKEAMTTTTDDKPKEAGAANETTKETPPVTATPTEATGPEPGSVTPTPPDTDPAPTGRRRRRSTSSTGAKNKGGRPSNHAKRAERVTGLYKQMGGALEFAAILDTRLSAAGMAMAEHADTLGEAWAAWADSSERVADLIDRMSVGGVGLAVLLAHLPILQAVRNHDPDDPEAGGGILDMLKLFGGLTGAGDPVDVAGLFGDAAT